MGILRVCLRCGTTGGQSRLGNIRVAVTGFGVLLCGRQAKGCNQPITLRGHKPLDVNQRGNLRVS